MKNLGREFDIPGYYELLPVSPFAKIDDGRGSSYSIGDGYVLTGGHVVYFRITELR